MLPTLYLWLGNVKLLPMIPWPQQCQIEDIKANAFHHSSICNYIHLPSLDNSLSTDTSIRKGVYPKAPFGWTENIFFKENTILNRISIVFSFTREVIEKRKVGVEGWGWMWREKNADNEDGGKRGFRISTLQRGITIIGKTFSHPFQTKQRKMIENGKSFSRKTCYTKSNTP